jgi:hypothetical protein
MWNVGLIDRATFLRQLDAPDMQAELDLETADKLVIDEMLERMMDAEESEGEAKAFMAPSAYQDLNWGARRCQQKLNRGILDGLPEFNQLLLQRFLTESERAMETAAQKSALAAGNTNGAPPGAPMAPPPGAAPPPPDLAGLGVPGAPPMAA